MNQTHVRICVSDAARPGTEHVPATHLEGACWELIRTPLYATRVAAGDVVKIIDSDAGTFEIVRRGGNVSVQFYLGPQDADDVAATKSVAEEIELELALLGGRRDGATAGLIVFSVPANVGFSAIEAIFETAARRHPGAQWQYGNVYDPVTERPLGWWED